MPRKANTAKHLETAITSLQAERQKHADALAAIDALFSRLGITPRAGKRRGRAPGSRTVKTVKAAKGRKRRPRRKFKTSGNDSIMAFVKEAGAKGRTGAEIDKHWKKEGRSGSAYVNLGQLVKAKKLKREKIKGGRGSRYTAS